MFLIYFRVIVIAIVILFLWRYTVNFINCCCCCCEGSLHDFLWVFAFFFIIRIINLKSYLFLRDVQYYRYLLFCNGSWNVRAFQASRIEYFFDTAPWCYDFGDEIPYFTQAKFRKFHHVDTLWQKSITLPI